MTSDRERDIHQVRIQTDFAADGISVWIVLDMGINDRRVLRPQGDRNFTWDKVDPGTNVAPTMTLSDAHARALMSELLEHYHGTPDSNTQRADLIHERQRRDKLEDHILWALEMSTRPYQPPVGGRSGSWLGGQGGTASATSNAPQ